MVIFAALRAMSCAMDGLSSPFISPNIKHFQCVKCGISPNDDTILSSRDVDNGFCNLTSSASMKLRYELDPNQCYFNNIDSLRPDKLYCTAWSFNNTENSRLMNSLSIEQSLVCDRERLISISSSMYFVGAIFGLLFWGIISDRYGRKTAYVCSHFVTLIFGFCALFTQSMSTFIILRAINAFGMIGELIPRSIQVEMVATEYRFVCSVICQIGWATGILLVPALAYYNPNYRFILGFPVIVSALMLPWLIWLPESARWLIANKKYLKARQELRRAAKINGKLTDDIDLKIEQFNRQVLHEEIGSTPDHKRMGIGRSILAIFTNMRLLKDTISVFVLLFVAEVVYFSLTLNVADLGGSLYLNFVISGLSEFVSIALCAVLLAYLSRRTCLSLLLLASTVSYLLMALVNVYEESLSETLVLAVNAFGKLTAIGNLMVIILVSQEVFPTVVRQFGTSLCITVGKSGSAVAPFTHELGQMIGQSYCFGMFSLICLSCAILPFGLSETGNRELPDTVFDVEESSKRSGKIKKLKTSSPNTDENYVALYQSNKPITNLKNNSRLDTDKNYQDLNVISDSINLLKQQQQSIEDLNNNSLEPTLVSQLSRAENHLGSGNRLHVAGPNTSSLSNLSSANTLGSTSNEGSKSDVSNRGESNNK